MCKTEIEIFENIMDQITTEKNPFILVNLKSHYGLVLLFGVYVPCSHVPMVWRFMSLVPAFGRIKHSLKIFGVQLKAIILMYAIQLHLHFSS